MPGWFHDHKASPPAGRLSRAALYALRAGALSMTTAACGGAASTPLGGGESGDAASMSEPAYGAPADAASLQDVTVMALYGAFFAPDAETTTPADAGAVASADAGPTDASDDHKVVALPPYGLPPPVN